MKRTLCVWNFALWVNFGFFYPSVSAIAQDSGVRRVSLVAVIATPQRFDRTVIEVTGWASVHPESKSLCFARDVLSTSDCVWLDYDLISIPADPEAIRLRKDRLRKQIHHQAITVRGTFDAKHGGHLGMWSGAIRNIESITVIDRNHGPVLIDLR